MTAPTADPTNTSVTVDGYDLKATCGACGGPLEHVTGTVAPTEASAIVRCANCRTDWQIWVRMLRINNTGAAHLDQTTHRHRSASPPSRGTYVGGCRCDDCRAADSAYHRQREKVHA